VSESAKAKLIKIEDIEDMTVEDMSLTVIVDKKISPN
jgi:hypothetical protein